MDFTIVKVSINAEMQVFEDMSHELYYFIIRMNVNFTECNNQSVADKHGKGKSTVKSNR